MSLHPPPPGLPEELHQLWHASADKHQGDEEKFRAWLESVLDYLQFWKLIHGQPSA